MEQLKQEAAKLQTKLKVLNAKIEKQKQEKEDPKTYLWIVNAIALTKEGDNHNIGVFDSKKKAEACVKKMTKMYGQADSIPGYTYDTTRRTLNKYV